MSEQVPVAMLSEVGEQVVAVHGQSDQLRLLRPGEQRGALDRFAGPEHEKLLAAYRETYGEWCRVEDDLADRRRNARERSQEADLLRLGLAEIEAVAPEPAEDVSLAAEIERLAHADALRAAATGAHDLLLTDAERTGTDAATLVGEARRTVEAMAADHGLVLRALVTAPDLGFPYEGG